MVVIQEVASFMNAAPPREERVRTSKLQTMFLLAMGLIDIALQIPLRLVPKVKSAASIELPQPFSMLMIGPRMALSFAQYLDSVRTDLVQLFKLSPREFFEVMRERNAYCEKCAAIDEKVRSVFLRVRLYRQHIVDSIAMRMNRYRRFAWLIVRHYLTPIRAVLHKISPMRILASVLKMVLGLSKSGLPESTRKPIEDEPQREAKRSADLCQSAETLETMTEEKSLSEALAPTQQSDEDVESLVEHSESNLTKPENVFNRRHASQNNLATVGPFTIGGIELSHDKGIEEECPAIGSPLELTENPSMNVGSVDVPVPGVESDRVSIGKLSDQNDIDLPLPYESECVRELKPESTIKTEPEPQEETSVPESSEHNYDNEAESKQDQKNEEQASRKIRNRRNRKKRNDSL